MKTLSVQARHRVKKHVRTQFNVLLSETNTGLSNVAISCEKQFTIRP